MQLSLRSLLFFVIIANVVSTEYEKDSTVATDNQINFNESSKSAKKVEPRSTGNCVRRRRKASQRLRSGRTTYVKAYLSNPKLTADQQLAEKLARAELTSPKMRETFKKLTAVRSHRQSPDDSTGIVLSVADGSQKNCGRSGAPRRRRKRRRRGRKNRRRSIGSVGQFGSDRFGRSIDPTANRYVDGSNEYPQTFAKMKNNDLVPNSKDERSPINSPGEQTDFSGYNNNYNNQNYNPGYNSGPHSMDNDFSIPNRPPMDNSYPKNFYQPQNRQNSVQNFGYQNKDPVANGFNNFRRYDVDNKNPGELDSSVYSKYRSGPGNPFRLVEREDSVSPMNISSFNSIVATPLATSTDSEYSRQPETGSKNFFRVEKSFLVTKKTTPVTNESCTTTEMNPKMKGVGEASAVPLELEKTVQEAKSMKGMEFHLLPANPADEANDIAQPLQDQRNESAKVTIGNETKAVAGQILNQIIEELEDLKLDRSKTDRKEGLPCRLSGSWVTTEAGVRIDMLVTNRSVNVSMAKLNLPVGIARQGLINDTWNITGHAPFRRGGPFSLVAIDNHTKSLAVFVGACRVCQGIDTIEGVWSIAREPRDCRDFQVATSIHNDIFRRTNLLAAIKERQMGIGSSTKCTSTSIAPITKDAI